MIDVVIATFNRISKARELAYSIVKNNNITEVDKVILVDSTEYKVPVVISEEKIIHITTSHKNQPYQRFLGYFASNADYVIFLDDDMEIHNHELFGKTLDFFKEEGTVALAYNFSERHIETSLSKVPGTVFGKRNKALRKAKSFITCYPNPGVGRYGLCGTRGPKPNDGQYNELIGGGAFVAKREALYRNFNYQLFDLYENNLGKGEDGILGYTIATQGKMGFSNDLYLVHNDQQDSTYTSDIFKFARRVAYSRLYLSLEKTRLDGNSLLLARIHYHYYMLWRILGLLLNCLLSPSKNRKDSLLGSLGGWWMAVSFRFDPKLSRNIFWKNEAMKDLSK